VTQPPALKGAQLPLFGPCPLWPNGWMDQDATWCEGRPWPGPHCVRWEPSSTPLPKGAQTPIFGPCICCGRMDGWIKMPLGTKVGLGPGHIVKKMGQSLPPIFVPCLLWPNGRPSQLLLSTCLCLVHCIKVACLEFQ